MKLELVEVSSCDSTKEVCFNLSKIGNSVSKMVTIECRLAYTRRIRNENTKRRPPLLLFHTNYIQMN